MSEPTQAQNDSTRLHDATLAGVPIIIPGARERGALRVEPAIVRPAGGLVAVAGGGAAEPSGRGRLEHEREGGGAPSSRTGAPPSVFVRFWNWAMK